MIFRLSVSTVSLFIQLTHVSADLEISISSIYVMPKAQTKGEEDKFAKLR